MSAVLGIFNRSGQPVTAEMLQPGLDALACYVSDCTQVWTNGPVGFAHKMLRITPESVEEVLPLTVGDLTITADARIDYRDDLFAALAVPQVERTGMPDSLLILRAYEKWGKDCPKYLIGDYAFAIWDARTQSIFCARDYIGIRPFYYYATPEVFIFASDIRALLAVNAPNVEIDEVEIARFLLEGASDYISNFYTFFKNVYKLTYGHWLTVNREELRTERYWFATGHPAIHLPTMDDYADRLYELVEQAVAARLRTDAPVGTHLSGGMDSSAVTVIAARLLRQRGRKPTVFSWSPPPGEEIEGTEYRRILPICQQEGLEPLYTEPTLDDHELLRDVDTSTTPSHTMAMEAIIQRKARERGIRVMLSGWGGDEAVSYNGLGITVEWFLKGRWRKLASDLKLGAVINNPRLLGWSIERFSAVVLYPLLVPDAISTKISQRKAARASYIDPAFAARVKPFLRPPEPLIRVLPGLHPTQFRIYENGYLTARPESWAIFGAEMGITYAYPLLDRRVIEFIYGVPAELHVQDGKKRYLHRYAMSRVLPQSVAWDLVKDDTALMMRKQQWMSEYGEVRGKREPKTDDLKSNTPWVDMARLREKQSGKHPSRPSSDDSSWVRAAVETLKIGARWQVGSNGNGHE